jgi:hypothetical protein
MPTPSRSDAARCRRLNERLPAEYLAGTEEEWRRRPMTAEELDVFVHGRAEVVITNLGTHVGDHMKQWRL